MKTYTIKIYCGESTCYDFDTKKRCEFFGVSGFGTRPECLLFRGEDGLNVPLQIDNDCVQRCKQCLENVK